MALHVLAAIEAMTHLGHQIWYAYRKEAGMWFYRLYSCKLKYLCQSLHKEPREHILAAIDATSCMARFKDTCWATIYGIH